MCVTWNHVLSWSYNVKRCAVKQLNFRGGGVIYGVVIKVVVTQLMTRPDLSKVQWCKSQYRYILCYKYLDNLPPIVHLHGFYIAKTVFKKTWIDCAGKKMSTPLKNLGNCLFFPFQGININTDWKTVFNLNQIMQSYPLKLLGKQEQIRNDTKTILWF